MITILRIAIVVFVVWFFYLLVKDSRENGSKDVPMKTKILYGIMGFILNLLDTLGVGSNATQAAFFKFTKLSPDEELLGGIVGSKVITKLPVQKIRMILSVTLPCVAVLLVMKVNGFGPFGMLGTATGLSGGKLILSVAINFILGMLMCAGVGLYAPCMALCALVGMNITVAFPIMMGSCALLMPPASLEFVKSGRYNRDAAVIMSITGVIGVLIAYFIVKSMPTTILTYIVAVVLIYMAISFVVSNQKEKKNGGN